MRVVEFFCWWLFVIYMEDIVVSSSDFQYPPIDEKEDWGGICTYGKRQSPINLDPSIALMSHFNKLTLTNYDRDLKGNITNTGHSLQVTFDSRDDMEVVAGGLGGLYKLDQMHFHWGGSEHQLAGKRYALELHLVHHAKRYSSVKEAAKMPNGLAVLGVLFYVTEQGNPVLDVMLDSAEAVQKSPQSTVALNKPINPGNLLPQDKNKFFRYDGSLTTPGCNEVVAWTVFEKTLPVSQLQLNRFREIHSSDGKPLLHNWRPLQPLGDRLLLYHDIERGMSAGSRRASGTAGLTIAPIILLLFSQY